jgi:hypothetical protein
VCVCVRLYAGVCVRAGVCVCIFLCVRGCRCHVRACASVDMCCVSVRAHPHAKVDAARVHGHARMCTRALCVLTVCPSAPVTSRRGLGFGTFGFASFRFVSFRFGSAA